MLPSPLAAHGTPWRWRRKTGVVACIDSENRVSTGTRLLKVWPDVAEALNVSRSTAFALCASGQIRTIKIGRAVRVPVSELDHFINRRLEGDDAA